MSQNDLIALEANFKNWELGRGAGLDARFPKFVYYSAEHFLKSFSLTDEALLAGITDGSNDGGVDAFYFLINREPVSEDTDVQPKAGMTVNLVILQVESTEKGFKPSEVDKLLFFIDDLLDLSKAVTAIAGRYRPELLSLMGLFKEKYDLMSGEFPAVTVDFFYITRGDKVQPNGNAKTSADRVVAKVKEHLSKAEARFNFVNAQAFLEQVQMRPLTVRELTWAETAMQTEEGYIGLVKLKKYFDFISDNGELAGGIFESNVRGFQQNTVVNVQIRDSLRANAANFWVLNNGITILATEAGTAGNRKLSLRDPQIVNGLQTSREIYNHFREGGLPEDERSVLVRVVETKDQAIYDAVIKATNSQNKMPAYSLRATDAIHRQIEELFRQHDLYYDRRKGAYKDAGKPVRKIVALNEVLQSILAIVLRRPDEARARPGDYVREDDKYGQVFDGIPLRAYLTATQLMRVVNQDLAGRNLAYVDERNVRFYVAMYLAGLALKSAEPHADQIASMNINAIKPEELGYAFDRTWNKYQAGGASDQIAKGPELRKQLLRDLKDRLRRTANRKQGR